MQGFAQKRQAQKRVKPERWGTPVSHREGLRPAKWAQGGEVLVLRLWRVVVGDNFQVVVFINDMKLLGVNGDVLDRR